MKHSEFSVRFGLDIHTVESLRLLVAQPVNECVFVACLGWCI